MKPISGVHCFYQDDGYSYEAMTFMIAWFDDGIVYMGEDGSVTASEDTEANLFGYNINF